MTDIAFQGVTKVYPDGTLAVDGVDLYIPGGKLAVLVGPSGCGKTTLLRMVAGLESVTAGEILIGGQMVNNVPPKQRDVAMVFQNYALYPHMSVYENMGFSLKLRRRPRREIDRRVRHAAEILGLSDLLAKKPRALSGGQRQRVAMGRAIVREPQAFLMDEPLSNLDAKLRVQMRAEIARIQRDLGVTSIYVTHDQTEAMTLGDLVAVMRSGRIEQVDHPRTLYLRPANVFVAGFIGSPAMNLIKARLCERRGRIFVEIAESGIRLDDELVRRSPALREYLGQTVVLGVRPENLADPLLISSVPEDSQLDATIELREEMGSETYVYFEIDAPALRLEDMGEGGLTETKSDEAPVGAESVRARLVARFDPDTNVREGQRSSVCVDTRYLYFFDAETGASILAGAALQRGSTHTEAARN